MKKVLLFVVSVLSCAIVSADNVEFSQFNRTQPRKINSVVSTTNVRKLAATAQGENFSISVSGVSATSATVIVTPANAEQTYYFDIQTPELFDAYSEEQIAAAYKSMFDNYITAGAISGYGDVLSVGQDGYIFNNLTPNTEYVALAVGFDATTLAATTAFDTVHFTTAQIESSQNLLTLTIAGNGIINVTTTNDDPYFFWIETVDEYLEYQEDYSDAALVDEIDVWVETLNYFGIDPSYALLSGNGSAIIETFYDTWYGEAPETGKYIALAAPYQGAVNGTPVYVIFDYSEANSEGEMAIESVVGEDAAKATKVIRNGQLIIERNGVEYNAIGAQIR